MCHIMAARGIREAWGWRKRRRRREAAGACCTLNTQTDVLLLTPASFSHGAFVFLQLTPQPGLPHPLSRVPFSLFPRRWGGGNEATQGQMMVPCGKGECGQGGGLPQRASPAAGRKGWAARSSTSSSSESNLLSLFPQTYVFTDEEDDALKRRMGNDLSYNTTFPSLPSASERSRPWGGSLAPMKSPSDDLV